MNWVEITNALSTAEYYSMVPCIQKAYLEDPVKIRDNSTSQGIDPWCLNKLLRFEIHCNATEF